MLRLVSRRLLLLVPVLWLIASITFVLLRVLPGGPFDNEKRLPPSVVANLQAKYHLDKPIGTQYFIYMRRLAAGDLGVSYKYVDRSVNEILSEALPVSLALGALALIIATSMGILLGTIAAINRGTLIDTLAMFVSTIGVSLPGFLVGAVLIFIFGVWLKALPVALWESPWHCILPALTLAFSPAAYLARLTRASVLEVIEKDWVRTARSKGLPYAQTILRHVLRNAFVPIATVLGPLTAILITGSFSVEYIYAIPGMGRFFITAVQNRDYDLVIGTTLIFAVILVVANTIVDIAYQALDPRMHVES